MGKIGVGACEVEREQVHEVEQAPYARRVHLHGTVLGRERDAVLGKVRVRRELQPPPLAAQLDGRDAQARLRRMPGRAGKALVLPAQVAARHARVGGRRGGAGRGGDVARVLFRLGQVDGALEPAVGAYRRPADGARRGRLVQIAARHAQVVQVAHGPLRVLGAQRRERRAHLFGRGQALPHQAILSAHAPWGLTTTGRHAS